MPGLAPLKTRRPSAHLRRPETAAELEYVSVGCNRSVHGADWNHEDAPGGGLVAYGAHKAVAVYDPAGARVLRTLHGHDAPVTVVRWIPDAHAPGRWLVSGDADGAVILWHRTDHPARLPDDAGSGADGDDASAGDAERPLDPEAHRWRVVAKRKAHEGPVLDARAERAFARGDPRDHGPFDIFAHHGGMRSFNTGSSGFTGRRKTMIGYTTKALLKYDCITTQSR